MEKQLLTKQEIQERIEVLKDWIKNPSHPEMTGTALDEVQLYQCLLEKLEKSDGLTIENTVHWQIYPQIGILI